MKKSTVYSYSESLARYGDDPRAVHWGDKRTQEYRFKVLLELRAPGLHKSSVVDLGCGLGDLYGYLKKRGFKGKYTGIDITPGMVKAARKKHSGAVFKVGIKAVRGDYCFISGTFNDRFEGNQAQQEKLVFDTIADAFKKSKKSGGI